MSLQCIYCGHKERFTDSLYCRDCGAPYIRISQPSPIYPDGSGSQFRVINQHCQIFEIEPPEVNKNIFGNITLSNNSVDVGVEQRISIHFSRVPDFLRQCTALQTIPFLIRIRNMNNTIVIERKSRFIFTALPEIEIDKDYIQELTENGNPIIYLCPSMPARVLIPLHIKKGAALVEEFIIQDCKIKKTNLPILLGPENPRGNLEVDLDPHPELLAQLGQSDSENIKTLIICAGLREPVSLPVVFRQIERPELSLTIDRWTPDGYNGEFNIDLKSGLTCYISKNNSFSGRLGVGLKRSKKEGGKRAQGAVKIFSVKTPEKFVKIYPKGPFVVPSSKVRDITIDKIDQNISSTLRFEVLSRAEKKGKEVISVPMDIRYLDEGDYPHFIGLDFGTTNSCVAISVPRKEQGEWQTMPLSEFVENLPLDKILTKEEPVPRDPEIIPTILYQKSPHHTNRIGYMALSASPEDMETEFKRSIIRDESAIEQITSFFHELISRIRFYLIDLGTYKFQPSRIMMAVPTGWSMEREKLQDCCIEAMKRCGISRPKIIPIDESLAAISYTISVDKHLREEKNNIDFAMVIDFGGGTTDITVVENIAGKFTPIIAGGDPEFGGKEITEWLRDILQIEEIEAAELSKRKLGDPSAWKEWKDRLGNIKKSLDKVRRELKKRLKKEFTRILNDIVADIGESLIRRNNRNVIKNMYVFLAGGSSALYGYEDLVDEIIRDLIKRHEIENMLNLKEVNLVKEPKKCVSRGAFIYKNIGDIDIIINQNVSPFRVLWALPSGISPKRMKVISAKVKWQNKHGKVEDAERQFAVILDRNQPVPTPEKEKKELILYEDMNITKDPCPVQIYTQVGSASPKFYQFKPEDNIPQEISCHDHFLVYLDSNYKLKMDIAKLNA